MRIDADELGMAEQRDQGVATHRIGDQRRQLVDPVLADRGQQREPDAHPDRPRDLEHRARHAVRTGARGLDRRGRPRRDRQAEAEPEHREVDHEPIELGLDAPADRQPQADGGDRDADDGDHPLADDPARPAGQRADRDRQGERRERGRASASVPNRTRFTNTGPPITAVASV